MKRLVWPALTLCILTAACGSAGGRSLVRSEIGMATPLDAYDVGMRIINLNQFEIESIDTITDLRIETRWKQRRPFSDEVDLGIFDAESRIIITGRRRSTTALGPVYAIYMIMENRVRPEATGMWVEGTHTPMFLSYATEIVESYRKLIADIGIRRH